MKLFEEVTIGNNVLKNRMAMAAMTRSRANAEGLVNEMTAEYYIQRSTAGLILSEAVNISKDALGSPFTPGLFTQAQIDAWKKVTQAVHDKGGVIYAQLWHTGRVAHSVDKNGQLPFAPSAVAITGQQHFTSQGPKDFEVPRALTTEQVKQTVQDYKQAAINAIAAGFDGVELHAANGYLPNQFLADSSNLRNDDYGKDKSLFIIEVMKEMIGAIGGQRVGIKISPLSPYNSISFNDPVASYTHLIGELNKLDFAFIEIMKRMPMFPLLPHYPQQDEMTLFAGLSKNTVMANAGYTKATAEAELDKGIVQVISFGSTFLANPDLPARFKADAVLNEADRATMFGGGEKGYIDYPFMS